MTTFWRFLCYKLKSSALRTLSFTVVAVLIDLIGIMGCVANTDPKFNKSGLYMLATILCVVASVVPIFELAGLKNRRNLDTLYSFPIERNKMALVYYVSGFAQVMLIYTATFLVHYIYYAVQTDCFALGYMIPYYFLSLLLALVIYSVYVFVFTQANTVVDGVVLCALWIFVMWILSDAVLDFLFFTDIIQYNKIWLASSWGILYTPMNNLTVLYQDLVEINRPESWNDSVKQIMEHFYLFFVWGAVGLAAAVGYFISFVKKGTEKAGEISSSWFAYKTLIPVYGCCLLYILGTAWEHFLLYAIVMMTGYIVYRRGFRLKISDIIITVTCAVIPLIMSI